MHSACVLCSNGCGCDIAVKDGRMVGIRGRADDVVNHGRLGPKGLYGSWAWADSRDRLTRPLVRQDGVLVETDWDTAMERICAESRRLLDERGPLSHGFYTTGQLFIEEYYTLGVIGKAGIGTPHMDGNTRLCQRPVLRHRHDGPDRDHHRAAGMSRRPTQLSLYVGLLHRSESTLAQALRTIADGHAADADVYYICHLLADWSDEHVTRLQPMVDKYGEQEADEPDRLYAEGMPEVRGGPVGLLRDLQDLVLLAELVATSWTVVGQAAQGNRDADLKELADSCSSGTSRQLAWLRHRMKQIAPQALLAT